MKTVKALLKSLVIATNKPLTDLKGYNKLSDDQKYKLGSMMADIENNLRDDDFVLALEKFKII